jgi:hypothetical protein
MCVCMPLVLPRTRPHKSLMHLLLFISSMEEHSCEDVPPAVETVYHNFLNLWMATKRMVFRFLQLRGVLIT